MKAMVAFARHIANDGERLFVGNMKDSFLIRGRAVAAEILPNAVGRRPGEGAPNPTTAANHERL
jgi:hypothetical protein